MHKHTNTTGYIGVINYRFDAASRLTRTWLDDLSCSGSESSLGQCTHNGIGIEDCDHTEDVYVSCLGGMCANLNNWELAGQLKFSSLMAA